MEPSTLFVYTISTVFIFSCVYFIFKHQVFKDAIIVDDSEIVTKKYIVYSCLKTIILALINILFLLFIAKISIYTYESYMRQEFLLDNTTIIAMTSSIIIYSFVWTLLTFYGFQKIINTIYLIYRYYSQKKVSLNNTLVRAINENNTQVILDTYKLFFEHQYHFHPNVNISNKDFMKLTSTLIQNNFLEEAKFLTKTTYAETEMFSKKDKYQTKRATH